MRFLVPTLAALLLAGCSNTINTHQEDFSPTKTKGPWTDYNAAIKRGEHPEPPKEKK